MIFDSLLLGSGSVGIWLETRPEEIGSAGSEHIATSSLTPGDFVAALPGELLAARAKVTRSGVTVLFKLEIVVKRTVQIKVEIVPHR